jgi:predicted secreted hydrolase
MLKILTIALLFIMLALTAMFLAGESEDNSSSGFISVSSVMSGDDTAGYERAFKPIKFQFPRDYFIHPGFRTEWWYFTGNLMDKAGRRYGFQFTIFRNSVSSREDTLSGWESGEIYMLHIGLTDVSNGIFYSFEKFSRSGGGLAGFDSVRNTIFLENNFMSIDNINPTGIGDRLSIYSAIGDTALSLSFISQKAIIPQGNNGLSQKSSAPGNASYYFSLTRLSASGYIRIGGKGIKVTGTAWMDREWSTSALAPDQAGWDWFALQMDNNSELMFYLLRNKDGSFDKSSSGVIIKPDGTKIPLDNTNCLIKVLDTYRTHSGAVYPSKWELRVPSQGIDLTITPLIPDQEHRTSILYWEGAVSAKGFISGKPLTALGYVELTGYK